MCISVREFDDATTALFDKVVVPDSSDGTDSSDDDLGDSSSDGSDDGDSGNYSHDAFDGIMSEDSCDSMEAQCDEIPREAHLMSAPASPSGSEDGYRPDDEECGASSDDDLFEEKFSAMEI